MDRPTADETQSLFPKSRRSEVQRSVLCLLVLFVIYVLTQADRQALAVLIPSGLRCFSNFSSSCEYEGVNATDKMTTAISVTTWTAITAKNDTFSFTTWEGLSEQPALGKRHQDTMYGSYLPGDNMYSWDERAKSICTDQDCIHFSDTQQGVLTGPAFTFIYCIAGIPFARLADATSRVRVFLLGLLLTALMVLFTAVSKIYWMLLFARILLGVGEAICNPASYALIADYFDSIDRTKALSFYHFGVYAGGAVGYAMGAINSSLCWRWTFGMLFICLCLSVLFAVFILHEPERKTISPLFGKTYTLKETIYRLRKSNPYLVLCLAAGIRNIGGYALGAWLATYYARVFFLSSKDFGLIIASIVLIGGGVSSLFAGYLADRFSEHHRPAKAYIITISQVLAIPFTLAALMTKNVSLSYAMLFLAYLTAETWLGCAAAIVQDLFTPSMRTQASAVYITVNTIIGGCLGPILVPPILNSTKDWAYCDQGIGYALSIVVGCSYLVSAVLFWILGCMMKDEDPTSDDIMILSYDTSDIEPDFSTEADYQF